MDTDVKILRKENPRARIHPIGAALFLHMVPIFWRFYKKEMREEDLYDVLEEHKSSKLGDTLEILWAKECTKHKKAALHFALLRQFGLELAMAGSLICISAVTVIILVPLAIGGLVTYFQNGSVNGNIREGYYYATLVGFGLGVGIFVNHPATMWTTHICMKMRVACCSLIYRKSLRLSAGALSQTTIGQIVNLLSNDVSKFDQGFMYWHYVFIGPIQTAVGTYLLYRLIGVAALSGIAFMLLFVPLQIFLGKVNSKLRLKTAVRTDERLRLMNEILSGINVIKMYTWEAPFEKLVSIARRYEIKATRAHFCVVAIYYALQMFVTRTSVFITIVVLVSLGNDISANTVYSIAAIYNILRYIMILLFSGAIAGIADTNVSVSRIHKFLSYEEIQHDGQYKIRNEGALKKNEKLDGGGEIKKDVYEAPKVILKDVCVKWVKELPEDALHNISLNINSSQLVAVIGAVGSGKSTLLNIILKELPIHSGYLYVTGKVSLAFQEPWLFSASVRQNIIFGDEYDEDRYKTVLNVCALESDLNMFPYGDSTMISESGKSLSGGQKARISLARCVYRKADIYLLDDPLSAVDPNVGKYLYENCIRNFLSNKICILITHQLQYLRTADNIVVLSNGNMVGQGTFRELQKSDLHFAKLLKEFHSRDEQEQTTIASDHSKLSNGVQEKTKQENHKNKETFASGSIGFKTYQQYFRAGGSYFLILILVLVYITAHSIGYTGDYIVAYWVGLERGNPKGVARTSDTFTNTSLDRESIIYIYSGVTILSIFAAISNELFFFIFVIRAAMNLHNRILDRITYASMKFFNENPTGRILNRFAKDVGIIDEYMPAILRSMIVGTLVLVAAIIISVSINPWILLPFAVLLFICYHLRLFYLSTSRSVKRIEGIARSPIFNHMSACISGLPTIRAFAAQKTLIKEFDTHQDFHSSTWYLFIAGSRAFGFWLDTLFLTFVCAALFCLLTFDYDYHGGYIGLMIIQYMTLCDILQFAIRQWCELENHITSVERVLEYTKVEKEPVRKSVQNLKKGWPEHGKIVFQNVSMGYVSSELPVVKDLNLTIHSGEKIGIVGRTGAGKSSIIAALFQLYETNGSIIIDDIDITKLPLKDLRSKISIIPQDPVLFSGTLRKNLDPVEEYSDDVLWKALERVELKQVIDETTGGLSTTIAKAGCNFSVGQRQLICLARAVIRENQILVMDEATANVDPHTDTVIQKTIRHEFAHCTVLTVAHRLHTIMDSDQVLVMHEGSAVEFDHPYNLLKSSGSRFYKMVEMTGKGTRDKLHSIAEESFKNRT